MKLLWKTSVWSGGAAFSSYSISSIVQSMNNDNRWNSRLSKIRVVIFSGNSVGICNILKVWPERTSVRIEVALSNFESKIGKREPSSSSILWESVPKYKKSKIRTYQQ